MSSNTLRGIKLPETNSDLTVRAAGQTVDTSNTPITYDGIGWTVRGHRIHTKIGLVIFIDVLGMKGIWQRLSPIEVKNRWDKVIRSLKDSLEVRPPKEGYIFKVLSDTIIITIPTSQSSAIAETFEHLIQPFIESLRLRMLLRGVITYGTYYISERLVIGEALDDAAYHHNKLDWIGIALSPTLSRNSGINTLVGSSLHTILLFHIKMHPMVYWF